MRAPRVVAILVAGQALAVGCGASGKRESKPALTVSAAASLSRALTRYATQFSPASTKLSFAGSDLLAAQIQRGFAPDVFAAANTGLPAALHARGLVDEPVVFAQNRLVVAVPATSTKVRALADLARPGVRIAIGSATVPIGAYTRAVLARLPALEHRAVLANVASVEPDVSGVVAKVTEDAVDAGLVYRTDVTATSGRARAVELPDSLEPVVAYAAAVVSATKHPNQARAFIDGLLHGAGRADLLAAGFLSPAG